MLLAACVSPLTLAVMLLLSNCANSSPVGPPLGRVGSTSGSFHSLGNSRTGSITASGGKGLSVIDFALGGSMGGLATTVKPDKWNSSPKKQPASAETAPKQSVTMPSRQGSLEKPGSSKSLIVSVNMDMYEAFKAGVPKIFGNLNGRLLKLVRTDGKVKVQIVPGIEVGGGATRKEVPGENYYSVIDREIVEYHVDLKGRVSLELLSRKDGYTLKGDQVVKYVNDKDQGISYLLDVGQVSPRDRANVEVVPM